MPTEIVKDPSLFSEAAEALAVARWLEAQAEGKRRIMISAELAQYLARMLERVPASTEPGTLVGVKPRSGADTTWLAPYLGVWRTACGADHKLVGAVARALRRLHLQHGPALVLERWRYYLNQTEPRYANPWRFASTFGAWVDPMEIRPGEDVYEYGRRISALRAGR